MYIIYSTFAPENRNKTTLDMQQGTQFYAYFYYFYFSNEVKRELV